MRDEDRSDVFRSDASFNHSAYGPDSAVDQIQTAVNDKKAGRFGAFPSQGWSPGSAEE